MDVIKIKHKVFFRNIELKISEVLVTKGDLVFMGGNWVTSRID